MADTLPVLVSRDGDRHFQIVAAGRSARGFGWDEMLGAVASLTHPEIRGVHPGMYGAGSEPAAPEPRRVNVEMSIEQAEAFSSAMADVLCWCRGFEAALPDALDRHPLGVGDLRELRILLNRAIGAATGVEPKELPF